MTTESLLTEQEHSMLNLDNNVESLLNSSEPADFDVDTPMTPEEKQRIIDEHNQRVIKSPEYQARVLANQYIANAQQQGIYMTGQQKKTLYKKYLRKAQKGRFNYLFDEEKQRRRQERMQAKFDKLNRPQEHTVDEIPENVQERLKEMVNEEPWHDIKPDNV